MGKVAHSQGGTVVRVPEDPPLPDWMFHQDISRSPKSTEPPRTSGFSIGFRFYPHRMACAFWAVGTGIPKVSECLFKRKQMDKVPAACKAFHCSCALVLAG